MTPKEKAKQLIISYTRNKHLQFKLNDFLGKQCALIAVDEIIKSNPIFVTSKLEGKDGMHEAYLYWKKVKQEIEKL